MHSRKLVSFVLAALLLVAPAALTAAPASLRPAAATSPWDAALARVRAILLSLLPPWHPTRATHEPGTPRGQQTDTCGSADPDGRCGP